MKKQADTNNNKNKHLNLIVQYLEKYSGTVQQLAYRCWHQVNKQEELESYRLEEEGEVGDGRAEGSSAIGNRGQAAISLTSDVAGTYISMRL